MLFFVVAAQALGITVSFEQCAPGLERAVHEELRLGRTALDQTPRRVALRCAIEVIVVELSNQQTGRSTQRSLAPATTGRAAQRVAIQVAEMLEADGIVLPERAEPKTSLPTETASAPPPNGVPPSNARWRATVAAGASWASGLSVQPDLTLAISRSLSVLAVGVVLGTTLRPTTLESVGNTAQLGLVRAAAFLELPLRLGANFTLRPALQAGAFIAWATATAAPGYAANPTATATFAPGASLQLDARLSSWLSISTRVTADVSIPGVQLRLPDGERIVGLPMVATSLGVTFE